MPATVKLKSIQTLMQLSFLAPFFFGISVLLLSHYVFGDQVHYQRFYDDLMYAEAGEVMLLARTHVSSSEPITAYVLWLGAQIGIEKNFYVSFFNTFLLSMLFFLLKAQGAKWYVVLLLLTNFYVVVLLTGAERLKFAYILFAIAALLPVKYGLVILMLSPLAHLSSIIFIFGLFSWRFADVVRRAVLQLKILSRHIVMALFCAVFAAVVLFYAYEAALSKASIYSYMAPPISSVFNLLALLVCGLFVSRDRFSTSFAMIAFVPFVLILGPDRVNMIAFSVFIYILLMEGRLSHPVVLLLLVYLTLKTIPFVQNIFLFGNGFYGIGSID